MLYVKERLSQIKGAPLLGLLLVLAIFNVAVRPVYREVTTQEGIEIGEIYLLENTPHCALLPEEESDFESTSFTVAQSQSVTTNRFQLLSNKEKSPLPIEVTIFNKAKTYFIYRLREIII